MGRSRKSKSKSKSNSNSNGDGRNTMADPWPPEENATGGNPKVEEEASKGPSSYSYDFTSSSSEEEDDDCDLANRPPLTWQPEERAQDKERKGGEASSSSSSSSSAPRAPGKERAEGEASLSSSSSSSRSASAASSSSSLSVNRGQAASPAGEKATAPSPSSSVNRRQVAAPAKQAEGKKKHGPFGNPVVWDRATNFALIDAFTRVVQAHKKVPSKAWQAIADAVNSKQCNNGLPVKTGKQAKNRMDHLKKQYHINLQKGNLNWEYYDPMMRAMDAHVVTEPPKKAKGGNVDGDAHVLTNSRKKENSRNVDGVANVVTEPRKKANRGNVDGDAMAITQGNMGIGSSFAHGASLSKDHRVEHGVPRTPGKTSSGRGLALVKRAADGKGNVPMREPAFDFDNRGKVPMRGPAFSNVACVGKGKSPPMGVDESMNDLYGDDVDISGLPSEDTLYRAQGESSRKRKSGSLLEAVDKILDVYTQAKAKDFKFQREILEEVSDLKYEFLKALARKNRRS